MKRPNKHLSLLLVLILGLSLMLPVGLSFATEVMQEGTTFDPVEEEREMTLEDYREQQKELEIEKEQLGDEIDRLEGIIEENRLQIFRLEDELHILQEQIALSQEAIDLAADLVARYEVELEEAQIRLAERQQLLQQRLVSLYVYGEIDIWDVLTGTSSFADFLSVYDMTSFIMDQDEVLLSQVKTETENIAWYKKEAEAAMKEQEEAKARLMDQEKDLEAKKAEYNAVIANTNVVLDETEEIYQQTAAAAEAVTDMIRDLLASSDSTISFGGSFIWPLPSSWTYVSSEYGYRTHPIYGDYRFHSGIDIPASGGTHIYSAADGKVILAEWISGYGETIMVDHGDGVVTLYAHMSGYGDFGVGEYVVAGDVIGYVGTTGASTGNHLHFETRLNGSAVSPWDYLK